MNLGFLSKFSDLKIRKILFCLSAERLENDMGNPNHDKHHLSKQDRCYAAMGLPSGEGLALLSEGAKGDRNNGCSWEKFEEDASGPQIGVLVAFSSLDSR